MPVDVIRTKVALGARSYEVLTGAHVLDRASAEIMPLLLRPKLAVVTDETVAQLHLARLKAALPDVDIETLVLPAGEATKAWPELEKTVDWLLDQKIERGDMVLALGGGVIGDLVGFADRKSVV